MNLAIIIGVSNYTNLAPLPACANDAKAIFDFFQKLTNLTISFYFDEAGKTIWSR